MIEKVHELNYFSNSGILYIEDIPRVTQILSEMLHEDTLLFWANSLGFKRISYKQAIEQAADIGTTVHNTAENILRNKNAEEYSGYYNNRELNNSIHSFLQWYEQVKDKIEVLSMEVSLVDNAFRGTYDLLARINGKIYLVDFKTSNHIGYRYMMQLAAYRYLIKTNLNIDIEGCLILQLSKKTIKFKEYVLDFSDPNHLKFINECQDAFFSLVHAYHYRKHIESRFKEIF